MIQLIQNEKAGEVDKELLNEFKANKKSKQILEKATNNKDLALNVHVRLAKKSNYFTKK